MVFSMYKKCAPFGRRRHGIGRPEVLAIWPGTVMRMIAAESHAHTVVEDEPPMRGRDAGTMDGKWYTVVGATNGCRC